MAYIAMAYIDMAYIAMAYIAMAYIAIAYIAMAYIVMAYLGIRVGFELAVVHLIEPNNPPVKLVNINKKSIIANRVGARSNLSRKRRYHKKSAMDSLVAIYGPVVIYIGLPLDKGLSVYIGLSVYTGHQTMHGCPGASRWHHAPRPF